MVKLVDLKKQIAELYIHQIFNKHKKKKNLVTNYLVLMKKTAALL